MSRWLVPTAVGAVGLLTLTACGGQSSTATPAATTTTTTRPVPTTTTPPPLPPNQLVAALKTAIPLGTSVEARGSSGDSSGSGTLDLKLNKDGSASGKITANGVDVVVIVVNNVSYVQLDKGLVEGQGIAAGSAAEAQMVGKWVPSTSKLVSGMMDSLKDTLNYDSFLNGLIGSMDTSPAPELTLGGLSEVNGELADDYKEAPEGSEIFVGRSTHHLLRLVSKDKASPANLDFIWNQPTSVSPPPADQIYHGPGA